MTPRIYFAYGSNLNLTQMRQRCPGAIPVCRATLPDYELQFRFFADIASKAGAMVAGAVFEITPSCEAELDRYEGVAAGYYRKAEITVQSESGESLSCLVYIMTDENERMGAPSDEYYARVATGYADWGMILAPLEAARDRALEAR